ncbi:unnamed protein product [Caenorhabditis auriculariae]|uniref:Uncharacterized protein n=1 Tax=Caenorhabditis auriculariae TaxID=2777116 RepID=A0A8S1GTI4_9PELO|nr:unnamed protein product [Caenorhabditis auriculariae]
MKLSMCVLIMTSFDLFLVSRAHERNGGGGFDRLRERIHRRRHRLHKAAVLSELDETFEMMTQPRYRPEKSIPNKSGRRDRNEDLCQSERNTVELNTHSHEFDPPFIVEIRCHNHSATIHDPPTEQTCVRGMLRCVQQYGEVHVSRRGVGTMHWHPHTLHDVPLSCNCMWPVDKYGHQEL